MLTHNLGYPRIGTHRELKKACEGYWAGRITAEQLMEVGQFIRHQNWQSQLEAGVDLIPCNDFSFYDQVLDVSLMVGAIPGRYQPLLNQAHQLELYFAMARGYQKNGLDLIALEMTKWFDTNYHYLVPEFTAGQTFQLTSRKIIVEFQEAQQFGLPAKPVLIGPISYLLLGKEKESKFNRLTLLDQLLPVYVQILQELQQAGATYVQLDEPFLALKLTPELQHTYLTCYQKIAQAIPQLKIILATYFTGINHTNWPTAVQLPVAYLHLDLVRAPQQLPALLPLVPPHMGLSLGVVDGRNVWKNDFEQSLLLIAQAVEKLGEARVMIAPSCSLLHVPCDLTAEKDELTLPAEIKQWLAFARQKLDELVLLQKIARPVTHRQYAGHLTNNILDMQSRQHSARIHKTAVQQRLAQITPTDSQRLSPFHLRQTRQQELLHLPLLPTTTIGSFPQTAEVRNLRLRRKKGELTATEYDQAIRQAISEAIRWQEEIGLDVLVHGEFERTDMVEYFGELLEGFAFTSNGWVQSYGSRCVKPPLIYGDVERLAPMTVKWSHFAQSLTPKPVKGMLTGPITILQWSFVRDDQPRSVTAQQIALAIRDEVCDLEKAGIKIIQIDEPAIREGLPLQKHEWGEYLQWAVEAFRLSASGVGDSTQIHTHMCYSEFNDIMEFIAAMDADVITIETSRSQMELLELFAQFEYPNEIGPGVYDIHSPRIPAVGEMIALLHKAQAVLPIRNLWVNPDCGLKTRHWSETKAALFNMVTAAKTVREQI